MKKGQRPSKHIRRVHTKKGNIPKWINKNILKRKTRGAWGYPKRIPALREVIIEDKLKTIEQQQKKIINETSKTPEELIQEGIETKDYKEFVKSKGGSVQRQASELRAETFFNLETQKEMLLAQKENIDSEYNIDEKEKEQVKKIVEKAKKHGVKIL